jgi:hypothetical protein
MELLRLMLKSSGWVLGIPMLLSALAGLVLCAWATWVRTDRARRAALVAALTPLVLGCIGVPWATALTWRAGQRGWDTTGDWVHIGYFALSALSLSAVPLLWSALLRWRRPAATP